MTAVNGGLPEPAVAPAAAGAAAPPAGPQAGRAARGPAWAVLAVACAAQFMGVLDVTIVNVALPSISRELDMSTAGLQWVVNAYALPFAGLLLFGGRASDLFGRKRVFLAGLAVFTAASLAGGLAQGGGWIIAARAAQGVGGAILAPSTLALLTTTYTEPTARARALGLWSAMAGSAGAFGTLAGGVLTDLASWRWVLFVNVPVGVALFAGALAVLTESRGRLTGIRGLDVPGTLTVTAGLSLLVYGIVTSQQRGWDSAHTTGAAVLGLLLLGAFVLVESRAPAPLVPLRVFCVRSLSVANTIAVVVGGAMFVTFFFVSLYLQFVLAYRPLLAGLALLPLALLVIAAATVTARAAPRVGPRRLLSVGTAVIAVALAWLSRASAGGSYAADLLGPTALFGIGVGLSMVPLTIAATAGLPRHEQGLASGLLTTARQVGGALGLAATTTIAAGRTDAVLHGRPATGALRDQELAAGYGRALVVCALAMVAAAALTWVLPRPSAPHR